MVHVATIPDQGGEVGEIPQPKNREQTRKFSRMPTKWRERSFVRRCWELATFGLPEEDSTTWATYELAKWLAGVECYYLPSEIRAQKVDSLLWKFIEERLTATAQELPKVALKWSIDKSHESLPMLKRKWWHLSSKNLGMLTGKVTGIPWSSSTS